MADAHRTEDLKVGEVLVTMASRFTSGNSIPVERTQITRREWDAVVAEIDRLRDAVETVRQSTRMDMSISYMGFRYGVGSQFGIDSLRRAINENKHY